jgi:hypothetical protein
MKTCTVCKIEKEEADFFKTKNNNLRGDCKSCFNQKRKDRYANNKEKELLRNKLYRINNPEKIKEIKKIYESSNKDKINNMKREWADKNPEKRKSAATKYQRKKRQDIYYRLLDSFKTSFGSMLKKNNCFSKLKLLKYNREELIKHIESTWQEGMSWENYGLRGWHIDHIRPLSSFDIEQEEELLKAWELNNLRALWASENLSKSSNYMGIKYRYGNNKKN